MNEHTTHPAGVIRSSYPDVLFLGGAVICYVILATAFIFVVQDDPGQLLVQSVLMAPTGVVVFFGKSVWLLPAILLMLWFARGEHLPRRIAIAIFQLLLCTVFISTFFLVKVSLTRAVPFYLDPALHQFDVALHFGHLPLELSHSLADFIPAQAAAIVYTTAWIVPAMLLPVFLALIDGDWERRKRFLWLYLFVWIILGNVVALAGMSAGPVYFDRLFGTEVYATLPGLLREAGFQKTALIYTQEFLWSNYVANDSSGGSGISAFPSVHVGLATVIALYLADRSRRLLPIAIAIPVIFQFLSVYTGWHYAIDGYFSIIVVVLVWHWLKRRAQTPSVDPEPAEA